jgi:hypothetical protein
MPLIWTPFRPFLLPTITPLGNADLTLPLLWIQEPWSMDLSEPRSKSVGPDARVRIPESMPTIPPLVQLAGPSRVAPSSPRRRGSFLGELQRAPTRARVSVFYPVAGG